MSLYNVVGAASLVAGQPEDVSQVLANFQAIQTILNGGIDNTNINAAAAIAATKLSGYPSDATKFLRGDNTWGVAVRAVTSTPIINGTVSYSAPTGTSALMVEAMGAGGGGGGCATVAVATGAGGSGGGGGYAYKFVTANIGTHVVAVGLAGTAGASGANPGGTGGTTSFADTATTVVCSAAGGAGGPGTTATTTVNTFIGGVAVGGGATAGDVIISGEPSIVGWVGGTVSVAISPQSGRAAGPYGGTPVAQNSGAGVGSAPPNLPGGAGGGGGRVINGSASQAGGAGANGILVIRALA